jgi:hypothetical protein
MFDLIRSRIIVWGYVASAVVFQCAVRAQQTTSTRSAETPFEVQSSRWDFTRLTGEPGDAAVISGHFADSERQDSFYEMLDRLGFQPMYAQAVVVSSSRGSVFALPVTKDGNVGNPIQVLADVRTPDSDNTVLYQLYFDLATHSIVKQTLIDPYTGFGLESDFKSSAIRAIEGSAARPLSSTGDFLSCFFRRVLSFNISQLCGGLSGVALDSLMGLVVGAIIDAPLTASAIVAAIVGSFGTNIVCSGFECAVGGGVNVKWIMTPPDFVSSNQSYSVQWQVGGANQVSHTNVHYGTDPDPRNNYSEFSDIQSGGAQVYSGSVSIPAASFPANTLVYFVVHVIADGNTYYSPIVSSKISAGGGGIAAPHIDQITTTPSPPTAGTFGFTIIGTGFDPALAQVVFTGPGCAQGCIVPAGDIIGKTQSQIVGRATLAAGNFLVRVQNGGGSPSSSVQLTVVPPNAPVKIANLLISFSPNPVPRSNDGKWNYTVAVKETGGVGVNLTGLVVAGIDYSQNISNWFGTSTIPANGQISGGFTTTGSPGSLVWEFIGNGLTWSQSINLLP